MIDDKMRRDTIRRHEEREISRRKEEDERFAKYLQDQAEHVEKEKQLKARDLARRSGAHAARPAARFLLQDLGLAPVRGAPAAQPCPFCGEPSDVAIFSVATGPIMRAYQASCSHCLAKGPLDDTARGAASAWNRLGVRSPRAAN